MGNFISDTLDDVGDFLEDTRDSVRGILGDSGLGSIIGFALGGPAGASIAGAAIGGALGGAYQGGVQGALLGGLGGYGIGQGIQSLVGPGTAATGAQMVAGPQGGDMMTGASAPVAGNVGLDALNVDPLSIANDIRPPFYSGSLDGSYSITGSQLPALDYNFNTPMPATTPSAPPPAAETPFWQSPLMKYGLGALYLAGMNEEPQYDDVHSPEPEPSIVDQYYADVAQYGEGNVPIPTELRRTPANRRHDFGSRRVGHSLGRRV